MNRHLTSGDLRPRHVALLTFAALLAIAPRAFSQAPLAKDTFVVPPWAFPRAAGSLPAAPVDSVAPRHVHGSTLTFTAAQAQDYFEVLDWHPDSHPPMPAVVAHGRKPALYACGYCHLADGIGRPENAMLAGLPAEYIRQQLADMRSGARRSALAQYPPGAAMRQVADSVTLGEVEQAAAYFSSLRARPRSRVVETARIPRPIVGTGLYFRDPRGGTEPLRDRIVEMALDRDAHELHDPRTSYLAYVPPGSLRRGYALAAVGRSSGTKPCASCHGPQLRGVGLVPPLAGRPASYLLRQLIAFRMGTRSSPAGVPMRDEAATLDLDDMIAAAAYAASLRP